MDQHTSNAQGPEAAIEIVRSDFPRGRLRAALFDFDGTLSLLRRNWQGVMIPMMVAELAHTGTAETSEELTAVVEDFVVRLTGKQTIYQMIRLAEEVARRGGQPRDPLEYKHQYHELLWAQIGERVEAVRSGALDPAEAQVPGSRALLDALSQRGLELSLASGTDLHYVRDELQVLQLEEYFEGRVYGALDDYQNFSKAKVIQQMLAEKGYRDGEILGVGDGYVEIEEIVKAGGIALGVASDEETRCGINAWKRRRLIEAGAHLIVADYRQLDAWLPVVFG